MSKEKIKFLLTLANAGDFANLSAKLEDYLAHTLDGKVHDIVHQKSGDGLLHVLARRGHAHCLEFLLTKTQVFVDQRNLEDKTALHEAAQFGQDEAVEILLKHGAQVDSLKRADWTPLMLATTKKDNEACVNILLGAGADLRLVNKDGWTPFHLAVRTGDQRLLELLMVTDLGCWNTVSTNGRTPLHTACLAGLDHVVRLLLLLEGGAQDTGVLDVNMTDSCGTTPLMDAARGDHLDCVKSLLDNGRQKVDLDTLDRMGRSVVQVAAQAGAVHVMQYLKCSCGVEVGEGGTLHSAAREGQTVMVQMLVDWGVEVDTRDAQGRTPLFLSVSGQHAETSRVLLEAGADLDSEDDKGEVVRHLARKHQVVNIINQFISTNTSVSK